MPRSTCARRWEWTCGPTPTRSAWECVRSPWWCRSVGAAGWPSRARTASRSVPVRSWWPPEPAPSCPRAGEGPAFTCCTRAPSPWRSGPACARGCDSRSWVVAGSGARPPRLLRPGERRSTCSRLPGACWPVVSPPRCPNGSTSGWPASGSPCMRGDRFVRSRTRRAPCASRARGRTWCSSRWASVRPPGGWRTPGGAGAGGCGPGRPVGPFERPRGVRRRGCRGRWSPRYRTHLPGGHWTEALNAREAVATAVGAVGGRWGRIRAAGVGPAQPARRRSDPVRGSATSPRGGCSSGGTGEGRVGRREAARADEESDAWTRLHAGRVDRLLGLGRPVATDLTLARRAMLATRGHLLHGYRGLADPGATPAAMFPGEG